MPNEVKQSLSHPLPMQVEHEMLYTPIDVVVNPPSILHEILIALSVTLLDHPKLVSVHPSHYHNKTPHLTSKTFRYN